MDIESDACVMRVCNKYVNYRCVVMNMVHGVREIIEDVDDSEICSTG